MVFHGLQASLEITFSYFCDFSRLHDKVSKLFVRTWIIEGGVEGWGGGGSGDDEARTTMMKTLNSFAKPTTPLELLPS